MHQHFDKHLNIKQLILEEKPSFVVECGAGSGNCTDLLNDLQVETYMSGRDFPFTLHVINDDGPDFEPPDYGGGYVDWSAGVSYLELEDFEDEGIDFCLIDTDHNYWTLDKELRVLARKMRPGGLVVMHDTEVYGHTHGQMFEYNVDVPYPYEEIKACGDRGLAMQDAIRESIVRGDFRVHAAVTESCGAMAIRKT
jgi:SAM-dependent methyltransferase